MNKFLKLSVSFAFFTLISAVFCYGEVVNTSLGKEFVKIFPELTKDYIDLNANGKIDRLEDMDEKVPDTGVKDGITQVQEILDFIAVNYRFMSMDKLKEVRNALGKASGDIPQIIALNYEDKINDVIKKKELMGSDSLYLTPSALKKAQEEMSGYIATMLNAYKKEQKKYEADFSTASDNLFRMIEAGYPLPELNRDDRDLLVSLTIFTISKNKTSDTKRVKAAVRTLGKLGSRQAIPYLKDLLPSPDYGYESAIALGNIGNTDAREALISEMENGAEGKLKTGIIRALGKTGGDDSINILLSLLDKKGDKEIDKDVEKTTVQALTEITKHNTRNRKIYTLLTSYLANPDKELRILAIQGIANYKSAAAVTLLLPMLKTEKAEDVRIELVKSLSATNSSNAVPAITALLKETNSSNDLKKEVISSLGNNSNGSKSILTIIDFLGDKNREIRETTAKTLENFYKQNPKTTTGSINRKITTHKDELFLKGASALLAKLADPATTTTVTNLLNSPFASVKKNATWALYRIKPENNLKVVTELQKLVTSETESIEVRINAVRALGTIGFDPPRNDVWKTLLAPYKLQDVKYSTLKLFAVKASGELGTVNDTIVSSLINIISREKNKAIRIAAVQSLGILKAGNASVEKALVRAFKNGSDSLRLAIIQTLGDMDSPETTTLAPDLLTDQQPKDVKYSVLYSLSHIGGEKALSILLDMSADESLSDYVAGILEDADRGILVNLLARRIKTETDSAKLAAFQKLEGLFSDSF